MHLRWTDGQRVSSRKPKGKIEKSKKEPERNATVQQFDTFSNFGSSLFPLQLVDLRLRDILDVWQHNNTNCIHISFHCLSVENVFQMLGVAVLFSSLCQAVLYQQLSSMRSGQILQRIRNSWALCSDGMTHRSRRYFRNRHEQ